MLRIGWSFSFFFCHQKKNIKTFWNLTFYIKSGGGGIRTPVRTSSPLGRYKFSFAGILQSKREAARLQFGSLVLNKEDEPRFVCRISWVDGVPFVHEKHKRRRGLSVSPGNLIVVAYFFGPILAGLANRHLLPGGNRYPSNLLHPRNTEIVKDRFFTTVLYCIIFL